MSPLNSHDLTAWQPVHLIPTIDSDTAIRSIIMTNSRFKLVGAVHLLLMKDAQVLLLRRFNTGYEDGNYSVPAGHLDGNEPVSSAMIREALEEAGIEISASDLRVVHIMHRRSPAADGSNNERVDFFLAASTWTGEPQIMEPNKCDELDWFPINDLPSNVIPYIRQAIDAYHQDSSYSEFGWELVRA
jgi:8-oxo-dGTP diphosphatase